MKKHLYPTNVLLPLKSNKAPNIREWGTLSLENKVYFDKIEKSEYIGFACGFNGYEVIDIDNHFGDADSLFQFVYDNYDLTNFPIVKTMGGGYHIYYRCEKANGNQKYAVREVIENDESKHVIDDKGNHSIKTHGEYSVSLRKIGDNWIGRSTLVESRGMGGYVVCPPSPGYVIIQGDILEAPKLSVEEKSALESICKALNEVASDSDSSKNSNFSDERPGDLYNSDSSNVENTKSILRNAGWKSKDEKHWVRPGKDLKDGISATFGKVGDNKFYVFSSNAHPFEDGKSYSMFAVKVMCEYNGDYSQAAKDLMPLKTKEAKKKSKTVKTEKKTQSHETSSNSMDFQNYIRVGCSYFKKIITYDKMGHESYDIEKWDRQTLCDDFGKHILGSIRKYDKFINVPSHTDYKSEIGNCFNMYAKVNHSIKKGEFPTIEGFMKHIFGSGEVKHLGKTYSEVEMGYDYIQIMWQNPTQILPVLCLVSEENETGKTTFGNFLNAIFGANFAMMGQQELKTEFNGSYANKLVAMVDEGWIDYKIIDKLKQLATSEKIMLRKMYRDHVSIDFFCKWILCSNRVKEFIVANENDKRYWVRRISKFKNFDPNFLKNLISEIPAFLYFLSNRKLHTPNESRMHFVFDIIKTKALDEVIRHSKDRATKDFILTMLEIMESDSLTEVKMTLKDIKDKIFASKYDITISVIRDILQDQLKLFPTEKIQRYQGFGTLAPSKTGRYYTIDIETLKHHAGVMYDYDADSEEYGDDLPF